ncbi:hypothetical protein EUGRSUZ_H02198 [Eucalyptus grandis]|uniref:Uncharacterized protein n=2 Tax=Eucalyptus grandis TaxID=71139 RepID=A0ACC3JQT5_EUCGR|nr:hypothetical protein EUGRSUZ_H02198 [Eucalyptus grandis]
MLHPLMAGSSLSLGASVYFVSFGCVTELSSRIITVSHYTLVVNKSQPSYTKFNLVLMLIKDHSTKV